MEIFLENPTHRLEIYVQRKHATALASPILGVREGRFEETMDGTTYMVLRERKSGAILLEDTGTHSGLEVAGNIIEILSP